jgi:hypothetical protein
MSRRVFASLIVCVALLTQIGASFWGAAAARDSHIFCHRQIAAAAADASLPGAGGAPAQAPAGHDHASCSLCQLGFAVIDSEPPFFAGRAIAHHFRVAFFEPGAPAPRFYFNLNAPARAPPFLV